jgi:hypothetical protein
MEAVAKYAYTASSPTELSFNAGDNMKVIKNNLRFLFIKNIKDYTGMRRI